MQSSPFDTPGADLREPSEYQHRSYLKGTQPLWKTFWLFFILGTLALYAALWVGLYAIGETLIDVVRRWDELLVLRAYGELHALTAIIPQFLYACVSLVAVWRSSKKAATNPAWKVLARVFVCVPVIILGALGGYCLWVVA